MTRKPTTTICQSSINFQTTSILAPVYGFLFLCLLFPFSLSAENILLKKGGTIKGKVVDQDQFKLKVQKEDGSTVNIAKSDILKVVYKEHISAEEEEKLRKAAEEKALAAQEKDRLKKEKEEKELAEKQRQEEEKARLAAEQKEAEKLKNNNASKPPVMDSGLPLREALLSSLILPGYGQYKQGRKIPAFIYPTLFFAGIFATYESNRMYLNAKRDYNNLDNPYSETGLIRSALGAPSIITAPPTDPALALVANEVSPFTGQREAVERHFRNTQYFGAATVGLYIWQLIDVFLFHPKQSFGQEGLPERRESRAIARTIVDRLDAVPYSQVWTPSWETKTQIGYEISF